MHYGTSEDEKIGGDAEAAAREGVDEAAGEDGAVPAFSVGAYRKSD